MVNREQMKILQVCLSSTSLKSKDSEELTIEQFAQLLKDKKIKYKEGKPEEWFSTLEEKGGSLTKEGIAPFTEDNFKELQIPILVRKILKEWASPQGNNLSKKRS